MQSFCDNFGKCEPILIILSLLHNKTNCKRSYFINWHLATNLLPHYLAKFECSTVSYLIQKCANLFIYSKYLPEMSRSGSHVYAD